MKLLHLDCSMGAAGDMLTAALLELFDDKEAVCAELNALGLDRIQFVMQPLQTCGVPGTHMQVRIDGLSEHEHEYCHRTRTDVEEILCGARIPENVRQHASAVYDSIAQAESAVHGERAEQVHFHEVGALDAIADVTAVCYLLDKLQPDQITASPIHVGGGHVACAHGVLPVPAPATAQLLKGVPIYSGELRGELCTPTGAALLKHFVSSFGPMPVMQVHTLGCGIGTKEFSVPNCVRAFWGEAQELSELICELTCNLDDMTAEEIGFAVQTLRNADALDVYTMPIAMKKDRPGTFLGVLCKPDREAELVRLLFQHTTTLGIRKTLCSRYLLRRGTQVHETPYGPVRCKTAEGYGTVRSKWEYDDLAEIATREGISLRDVKNSFV